MAEHIHPCCGDNPTIPEVDQLLTELIDSTTHRLLRGSSVVLLDDRSMGKSVFLRQLEKHLKGQPGVAVFTLDPPAVRSLTGALASLAHVLEAPLTTEPAPPSARELIEQFLIRRKDVQVIVLIMDELDRYVAVEDNESVPLVWLWLNQLELARKNTGRLGVLVTGTADIDSFCHPYGSSIFDRAHRIKPPP